MTVRGLFVETSWYLLLALMLGWFLALCGALRESGFSPGRFARSNAAGFLAAIILASAAPLAVGDYFKLLGDESEVAVVGQSLARERRALGYAEALPDQQGRLQPVETRVPKRPLLLPFLAALLHPLPGSDYHHVLWVNTAALCAFLLLGYLAVRQTAGRAAAPAAVLLLFSSPLFLLCAHSALLDFLSMFWLFLCLVLTWHYLEKPTPPRFALLWMSLVMLCHIRYENVAFFVVIAGGLFLLGQVSREQLRSARAFLIATPPLLLPLVWQALLSRGRYTRDPDDQLFSVEAFRRNLEALVSVGFDLDLGAASIYSHLALPLFVLTALLLLGALVTGRLRVPERWQRHGVLLTGAVFALQLLIVLSHYRGDLRYGIAQRFYLTPFLVFGLSPLLWLVYPGRRFGGRLLTLVAVALFAAAVPGYRHLARTRAVYADLEAQRGVLAGYPRDGVIAVSRWSQPLVALGYAAVGPAFALKNADRILRFAAGAAPREILVFQTVDLVEKRVLGGDELTAALRLETIAELRPFREFALRVSRALPSGQAESP